MKVEVDVDLNKIDYDKIEAAVMKRIEGDELGNILNLEYYTKEKMQAVTDRNINAKLDEAITRYTNASPDKKLDDIINETIREAIKEVCMGRIKEVIEEMGGDEKIKEITHQCIGNMFATVLYEHMQSIAFASSVNYAERQSERCRNDAKEMIENAFYQSGHPVPSL